MQEQFNQYLINNEFYNTQFIVKEENEYFYLATDTEDNNIKMVCFTIGEIDNIIVSVRHSMNDNFYIYETVSLND